MLVTYESFNLKSTRLSPISMMLPAWDFGFKKSLIIFKLFDSKLFGNWNLNQSCSEINDTFKPLQYFYKRFYQSELNPSGLNNLND